MAYPFFFGVRCGRGVCTTLVHGVSSLFSGAPLCHVCCALQASVCLVAEGADADVGADLEAAPEAFIRAHTSLRAVPLVPEVSLYLHDRPFDIWSETKVARGGELGLPLPYWAFAWAGGQALARFVLDRPEFVRGREVLDVASGSGLVAIAAMLAGAARATANDIDPFAAASMRVNAEANGVRLDVSCEDLLGRDDVIPSVLLVGDAFYEQPLAEAILAFAARLHGLGITVLCADPGRPYFASEGFEAVAEYDVPVPRELEDTEVKRTRIWRMGE